MPRLSLQQRLRTHVGRRIAIEAQDFTSEAGVLQAVGPTFIRITGQFFVPSTANQLILFQVPTKVSTIPGSIRTTFRGTFQAGIRRVGSDFIEVIENVNSSRRRFLIPLNKVISIERT